MTSNADSALDVAADVLTLPKAEEACPYGLAPVSTTMQLAMGDALAVAFYSDGLTNMDFKSFHPGGKLGSGLMILNDIMVKSDKLPLWKTLCKCQKR